MSEDNFDDIAEFADAAESFEAKESSGKATKSLQPSSPTGYLEDDEEEGSVKVGQPTQYALYGPGFMPTTPTIPSLPPACYDIQVDNEGRVFVIPTLKPSGILLELPEMRSEAVIKVIDTFWNSEKDYKDGNEFVIGGAAYKSGVMIFGPPGTGKSCTIKIVCNKLVERGGTVFYAHSNPSTVMSFLEKFSRIEKSRKCIVILEDIDSLIQRYEEAPYLEMLDSAKTIDNVVFIATTNYPDRLDPRIYNRPGRFSHVIKIGLPSPEARRAYLKAVLKNHRDVETIVEHTDNFTIDHLSSLLNAVYREKKDLHKELKRLRLLFKVPKLDEKSMGILGD